MQGCPSDAAALTKCLRHYVSLGDVGFRRHVGGQSDIAADLRSISDADTTEDRRTGIDHYILVHYWKAGYVLYQNAMCILQKGLLAQRDSLINAYPTSDHASSPIHHTGSMVDGEALSDRCCWMYNLPWWPNGHFPR